MQLSDLQQALINNITTTDNESTALFDQLSDQHLAVDIQLDIYKNNHIGSIQKTLKQIYPACYNILGEEYFYALGRRYQSKHFSKDHNLNNYGESFTVLLKSECQSNPNLSGYEYLYELARLEWNYHASYFYPNDNHFNFSIFSEMAENQYQNLHFELSHSLAIYTSIYPIIDIWSDNTSSPPITHEYSLPTTDIFYCSYRKKFTPTIELIDSNAYQTILAIKNRYSLESLSNKTEFDIAASLPLLIQKGWITGFATGEQIAN